MRQAENRPKNQREISAKLPENPPRFEHFNQQYQPNMSCEKNTAKNHPVEPLAPIKEIPKTENRKLKTVFELATENRPKNQREISAKLPKNPPRFEHFNQQYQ